MVRAVAIAAMAQDENGSWDLCGLLRHFHVDLRTESFYPHNLSLELRGSER